MQQPNTACADDALDDLIEAPQDKQLLRFITCGSVDDGKSTLIGRLLFESQQIFEDQLAKVTHDSKRVGTQAGKLDLALLVDGLQAEREQGITIDVAYRYFSTPQRKFIVADTPGHEQYTRNMATGASTADLAVILIDARSGLLTQSKRHAYICSLLGIRHLVVAINKMDLLNYDRHRFQQIEAEFRDFVAQLGELDLHFIPVSALTGTNVTETSNLTPWYEGPALLELLESIEIQDERLKAPFRLPVQWVNRPSSDFRGYAGTLTSGSVRPGDDIRVLPSGQQSRVKQIFTYDGDLDPAIAGEAVTLVLEDEIDVSRGDLLCHPKQPAQTSDQFAAHIIWLNEEPLLPLRQYRMMIGTKEVNATVTELGHKVNVNTLDQLAGRTLALNEVGYCKLSTDQVIPFDPYDEIRETGSFILIDRFSHATVGMGMIKHSLRRASNITWSHTDVDKAVRASLKHQRPCVLWFTGLSGSGKSTVANLVDKQLSQMGRHTYILDGDNVRHGLNRDLGFTDADRVENIRRIAEVAKLFVDAGLVVLVSFISPFRSEREMARKLLEHGEFVEIHMDTPLEVCEERDVKGLYKKARAGLIKNFTGIDSDYEAPENPELTLCTAEQSAEQAAQKIIDYLLNQE